MKRQHFILFLGIITLLLSVSCERAEVYKYKNDPSLYFVSGGTQADSTDYSFFIKKTTCIRDTVKIVVNLMGIPYENDRPIPIRVIATDHPDAAKEGVHYIPFDDPGIAHLYVMPRGEASAIIPVILLRDESLKNKEYRILLELFPNEDFNLGIAGKEKFLLKVSDIGTKPNNWEWDWEKYFGAWGRVKMKFIIDYLDFSEFDSYVESFIREYYQMKAKEKLAEYVALHGTLYEDDKITVVEFP